MNVTFDPVERITVSEEIAKKVLEMINTGMLKPGDKLPSERDLMDQLRVSRSSIREALRSLSLMGLLETRPGDGTYVGDHLVGFLAGQLEWSQLLSKRDIVELLEVRDPLEIQAAGLAAQRSTPATIATLREAVAAYRNPNASVEARFDADMLLHNTIAAMSGNRLLIYLLSVIRESLREYVLENRMRFSIRTSAGDDHQRLVEAIQAGDELRARAVMAQHLQAHRPLQLGSATQEALKKDIPPTHEVLGISPPPTKISQGG